MAYKPHYVTGSDDSGPRKHLAFLGSLVFLGSLDVWFPGDIDIWYTRSCGEQYAQVARVRVGWTSEGRGIFHLAAYCPHTFLRVHPEELHIQRHLMTFEEVMKAASIFQVAEAGYGSDARLRLAEAALGGNAGPLIELSRDLLTREGVGHPEGWVRRACTWRLCLLRHLGIPMLSKYIDDHLGKDATHLDAFQDQLKWASERNRLHPH